MEYFRSSIKVALLFLISCLVLAYFVLHAGQVRVMGKTQDLKLLFSSVGNLKFDSPVTYSGYKVGQVVGIRPLTPEERRKHERVVEVLVRIQKDVVVRQDSVAEIQTLGFLGEKFVEISPGSLDSLPLDLKESLYGRVPQDISTVVEHFSRQLDELVPLAKDILEKLRSTVEQVDQLVREIATQRKIQSLLDGANAVTQRINEILDENREKMRETFKNAEAVSGNLKEELRLASPKIQNLIDDMNSSVGDLDQLLVEARELVSTNRPGISKTLSNLEEASEHAKGFLKILKEEPWRLLSKPRPVQILKGPKRGYVIYKSDSLHSLEGDNSKE